MEQRIGNVIIQAPGGNAAKGSNTYKVSLPSAWVKEMGITGNDRQICKQSSKISQNSPESIPL